VKIQAKTVPDSLFTGSTLALLVAFSLAPVAQAVPVKNPPAESAGETIFDLQAMRARGVDPSLAEWFRQAPRFMPGETTVALTVNGSARGKVKVRFDNNGRLCADSDFQKLAGLIMPPGFNDDVSCADLKSAWPQTELHLDPGEARVDVVLPPQAVAAPGTESGNWNHGGFAGMLNYNAQYMDSTGASSGITFMQFDSEGGFNISDWIVRSRQTFSRFNGEGRFLHQNAYAQRSFVGSKQVLQAGQISLSNSMFGTGQVLGFQMFPEPALQGNRGGPGLVEGTADSQSVVEIRQSGVLVYSSIVPAGPFRLQGFPLLNTRSDLHVELTGSNGEKRQFTVPASALLLNGSTIAPGLSFGAGKLDQAGSSESPLVATMSNGWMLSPHTTLNAGILGSTPYRAGGVGVDSQIFDATLLSVQTTLAQDEKHGRQGLSATAILNHNLTERVSLSLNVMQQTSGYRELNDALHDDDLDSRGRTRGQIGSGVGWSQETLGNLSLSWALSNRFEGGHADYFRGGWSRQFEQIYVGASLEHDTGVGDLAADNRFYLTVNIPFGTGRSVSSYFNGSKHSSRAGMRYSERTSRDRGWSLSSEQDFKTQRASATGNLDMVTPVSQLGGSLSRDSDNYTSWSARATGAVVAHANGVSLSPYRVGDTFGVAKVGEEAGVRLDTPAGPAWTDGNGYAVLPTLSGYKRSSIQVDTRSLARNVDIMNAWQETEAARGSVNYVNFDVVKARRVLVAVKDAQGQPLLHGTSIFDAAGNFITVTGEQGNVFIPDATQLGKLDVQSSGNTLCSFTLVLPEEADTSGLYETSSAVCR
jgi:outer membrane usher protein FimD/PapC